MHWIVPMIYPFSQARHSGFGRDTLCYGLYLANPLTDGVLLIQRAFWVPTTSGLEPGPGRPTPACRG